MTINHVWLWLAELEEALADVPPGSMRYADAQKLFEHLDTLAMLVADRLVIESPDYPDAEDDD